MLSYKKGSVIQATEEVIAHGCNCQNVMGAGVAKAIRAEYPEAFTVDKRAYFAKTNEPGSFSFVYARGKFIFNLYTQKQPGPNANLHYIEKAIAGLEKKLPNVTKLNQVAIPRIGCGIGGLDWNDVSQILEKSTINFVVYDI